MTAPKHAPTPEQIAIIDAALNDTRSLLVRAGAGCAKTTTLEMIAEALPKTTIGLCLAFNRKIVDEMEKRMPPNFTVKSFNGVGHAAWTRAIGKRCAVDEKKLGKIVTEVFRRVDWKGQEDDWGVVRQLASAAMNLGLVPRGFSQRGLVADTDAFWRELCESEIGAYDPDFSAMAREVITLNIKKAFDGTISYDDQVYMSTMFGGVFPRFPLVMVDEAQDLGLLNHMQVRRCASARLIVVGDEKQAIYAFRGADADSIDKIKALRSEWLELPLETTFRCPKVIVARQQEHAPGFKAWHTNSDGFFADWFPRHENEVWSWQKISQTRTEHKAEGFMILCRNNGPLLGIAFKLLRQQVGVQMLGRDIGKGLVALSKKVLPHDDLGRDACAVMIKAWEEESKSLAMAQGKEEKCDGIEDRAACLQAVLEGSGARTAGDLRTALGRLFARDSGQVVLSTGHRAKGLEDDMVLHLDPWRLPSKWAQKSAEKGDDRALKQEWNLNYVIETRARKVLVLANLEDFQ